MQQWEAEGNSGHFVCRPARFKKPLCFCEWGFCCLFCIVNGMTMRKDAERMVHVVTQTARSYIRAIAFHTASGIS